MDRKLKVLSGSAEKKWLVKQPTLDEGYDVFVYCAYTNKELSCLEETEWFSHSSIADEYGTLEAWEIKPAALNKFHRQWKKAKNNNAKKELKSKIKENEAAQRKLQKEHGRLSGHIKR